MTIRAFLCCAIFSGSVPAIADEPGDEPPLEIALSVDGQTIDARLDEPVTATIDGKPHVVTLKAKSTRMFSKRNVEFRYPSYFTFEYDNETPGVTIYTVEGHDSTLMVQFFDEESLTSQGVLESVVDEMRQTYKESLAGVSDTEARLGGKRIKGRRVIANFGGQQLHQDIFPLTGAIGILMYQRVTDEQNGHSAETKEIDRLLNQTFRMREEVPAGGRENRKR